MTRTIRASHVSPPPSWAVKQRFLIDKMNVADREVTRDELVKPLDDDDAAEAEAASTPEQQAT